MKNTTPAIATPSGPVIGWYDDDLTRYTGIPYAKAERFGLPLPLPERTHPFEAVNWSPACPQPAVPLIDEFLGGSLVGHLGSDEQCQRLSITLPAGTRAGDGLPVMVWIHGGSYASGAGDALVYDPAALVREGKVIVVSITYRLGLLGFLGGYRDRPANLGLLDIREALRWIRANIESFGGDASNITLFGQSAGGDAIAHLMIADDAVGLFKRAIIQSAPLGLRRNRSRMVNAMCARAASLDAAAPLQDFVNAQARVAAIASRFGLKGGMPFGTQYGHYPLPPEAATETAWLQRAKNFEVLIGYTRDETSLFLPHAKQVQPLVKLPLLGRTLRNRIIQVSTGIIYRNAAVHFARLLARGGAATHLYQLNWGSTTNDYGATHSIDLPLLFGNHAVWGHLELVRDIPWDTVVQHGQYLRSLWTRFARTGEMNEQKGWLDVKKIGR